MLCAHLNRYVEEGRITDWAVPENYTFLDELPKTGVGRIQEDAPEPIRCSVARHRPSYNGAPGETTLVRRRFYGIHRRAGRSGG